MKMLMNRALQRLLVFFPLVAAPAFAQNQVFERTFESRKAYADPFNDVDVDVIFTRQEKSWRVPTFWRGRNKWTVRFAPPAPGEYVYHLESTDKSNPDLNGHEARTNISAYAGTNPVLKHGMLRVSANKRYFEHADGTPFYWLGDTWWTGLSDRLSWDGFQKLTADRKAKGFTVVQIVAGLIPSNEELAPVDPGFRNEGGAVWDPEFKRINPQYFDYADRRVQHLLEAGIVPAIVGGWRQVLDQMGVSKMKKHWRYVIARYGAYPVFWIVGGEVVDPPQGAAPVMPRAMPSAPGGWTEVTRYVRATDPYRHPLTIHESPPPSDLPLQDESLTDFDLPQPSHFGWPSVAAEVAQLNMHYARTTVTKPIVQGEIGYEGIGAQHLEDFQRVAFWLTMLNGGAGHTYGAIETAEAYTADKPLHRRRWSFLTWEEAMNLPGSMQVGLGAKLLRQYPWQRFAPHPEWVTPHGTTLLEPNDKITGFDIDLMRSLIASFASSGPPSDGDLPTGEWKKRNGNFRLPYAAGIPGEVRFIYLPYLGLFSPGPPTVLGLERGVRYRAYYWQPSLGIKFDLGAVQHPDPGPVIFQDSFKDHPRASAWTEHRANSAVLSIVNGISETNLVAAVDAARESETALILRYQDVDNYVAAVYSSKEKAIFLLDRQKGVERPLMGRTAVPVIGPDIRLTAEVRGGMAVVSITDGRRAVTTPIVPVNNTKAGGAGLMNRNGGKIQGLGAFELRRGSTLVTDDHLERKLYDARGNYRGELKGPAWDDFGKEKNILLDAYRPDRLPTSGDWVLVLEHKK